VHNSKPVSASRATTVRRDFGSCGHSLVSTFVLFVGSQKIRKDLIDALVLKPLFCCLVDCRLSPTFKTSVVKTRPKIVDTMSRWQDVPLLQTVR
jgi:hypothetical protein